MNESVAGRGPLVVGIDGSEESLKAVRWGAGEAARRGTQLVLMHALGIPSLYMGAWPPSSELREEVTERGHGLLDAAQNVARNAADVETETRIDKDDPAAALVAASRSVGMVVLGASGHGGLRGLGSTAVQVSAHAECPVVVVRGEEVAAQPGGPIVVGVDGSGLSDAAVGCALEEAALRGAPLMAVHAWHDNEAISDTADDAKFKGSASVEDVEQQVLVERLAGWTEKFPDVPVQRVIAHDKPRRKLVELSKGAQLVVVGSRGRGGFTGLLLGSTSQSLIQHADAPVMIVRPAPSAS